MLGLADDWNRVTICRPTAAQFMQADTICRFEVEDSNKGMKIAAEKHYRLVSPGEVTDEDLSNTRCVARRSLGAQLARTLSAVLIPLNCRQLPPRKKYEVIY